MKKNKNKKKKNKEKKVWGGFSVISTRVKLAAFNEIHVHGVKKKQPTNQPKNHKQHE